MITHTSSRTRRSLLAAGALLTASATLVSCTSGAADADADGAGAEPYRVVVMSTGTANDMSWANSVYDGVTAIDDPGIEVEFVGGLDESADYVQQGSAFAGEGYDLIVISHGAQASAATQLAQQFPDVQIVQGPWSPAEDELAEMPENLSIWNVKQQDGTFLAGVVAGLVTQTDRIAGVAGMEFPAVIRQPEGFVLGARCVNPDIVADIQYTGSFEDVAAAQSAAASQITAGADVIVSAVDGAVSGLYGAARDASSPVWIIPSYYDSYEQASDVVLTSVLYNLGGITEDIILRGHAGEIEPRSYLPYNYTNMQVGELADFHGNELITDEVVATLADIEERLRTGEIVVPDEDGADAPLSVPGSGSSIDPASIGC